MIEIPRERRASYLRNCRALVLLSCLAAAYYVPWLFLRAPVADPVLFAVLLAAESFNLVQAAGFWYTTWIQRWTDVETADFTDARESVDAFVTVCGEPLEIVERTVRAAAAMRHPRLTVWVLDDGPSADVKAIAELSGARYVTREGREGAKAGNLNNALRSAAGDLVAIFDADHAPAPSFLERTLACFADPDVAFVQTPQVYGNAGTNAVAAGANEQQALFYGPILRGKNGAGAVFSCGTNVVFRRSALDDVGGMPEDCVTEDLRVSLMLMEKGWRSVYVSEVLATGLGPLDVGSYFGQQLRWARGGLEILFRHRPFAGPARPAARLQFALSFMYWFNGWAYLGYLSLTLSFLLFGAMPVRAHNEFPLHFLPYVLVAIITMLYASGFSLTFRALWFTLASFPVHVRALFSALSGRGAGFVVTSKTAAGRSLRAVRPHLVLLALLVLSMVAGAATRGPTPSVVNNLAFAGGHILIISGFVVLAFRGDVRSEMMSAEEGPVAEPAVPAGEAVAEGGEA